MLLTLPDGTTIEIERDVIDCTPMTVPDLSWRFVDANGHEHVWRNKTKPGEPLSADVPSIRTVVDVEGGEWFDEDGIEQWTPPVTHYGCIECGATVPDPAVKANSQTFYIAAGLTRIRINGEPATEAQLEEVRRWTENERH